jgi:hypothetical protein
MIPARARPGARVNLKLIPANIIESIAAIEWSF